MQKQKDGFSGERSIVLPISVIQEMETETLASMLHITNIGYYPKAKNHFRERIEPISQYIFIYCIEGTGWFTINGTLFKVEKINTLFYLQVFLTNMDRTKLTLGLSIGFTSKENSQRYLQIKQTYLLKLNLLSIRV